MAISEGLQTADGNKESDNALLGEESDSVTEQKYCERKHTVKKNKSKLAKRIIAALVGIGVFVSLVGIIIHISTQKDEPRYCNANIKIHKGRFVNAPMVTQGDTNTILCDKGHKLNGSRTIMCLASGHWNETPICIPNQCNRLLLPEHVNVDFSHLINRIEEITVTCGAGFILEGNKTVVCKEDGTWSELPACKPVNCGYPAPIRNGIILNLMNITYNRTFNVLCNDGYNLRGSGVVRCDSGGTWGELPKCKQASCGIPIIPTNGHIKKFDGRSVSFSCENGFILVGNASSTCQSNGEWSLHPECKRVCPLDINIPNGRVVKTDGLNFSHTASIECANKHKLNGSRTIYCQPSGEWNATPACVRKQCQMFQSPSNAEYNLPHVIKYVDEEVTVVCKEGFRMKGNGKVLCQENETWSQIPVCKPVDCGAPLNNGFANGKISRLTGTIFESTFQMKCSNGYYLNGNSIVSCESDGKWSSRPKCERVSCGPPALPENAYSKTPDSLRMVFGSSVSFLCKEGFSLTGVKSSTCQSDGKWSVPYPKCEQIKAQPNYPKKNNSGGTRLGDNICPLKISLFVATLVILLDPIIGM